MADTQTTLFVTIALALLIVSFVLKKFKQPPVVAYILTGLLLGKSGFNLITQQGQLMQLGEIGVILLLFFIGMEMSLDKPVKFWIVPVIGTILQIILSVVIISLLGHLLHWPLARILLLGFIISLSSTAVILKLLQDWGELNSASGQRVLAILLAQDIAVVPMLIIINHFGGQHVSNFVISLQIIGGLAALCGIIFLFYKKTLHLSWLKKLQLDQEGQIFAALSLCFGFALIFSILHLSSAFGAFIGGLIVSATKETEWAHHSLVSLKVIFMAIFFVAIGMLMDCRFLFSHWFSLLFVLILVLVMNTIINALILRAFRQPWSDAWYCGALLAQIGEFSYVMLLVGLNNHLVDNTTYQFGISLITLSLLVSPFWAALVKWKLSKAPSHILATDFTE